MNDRLPMRIRTYLVSIAVLLTFSHGNAQPPTGFFAAPDTLNIVAPRVDLSRVGQFYLYNFTGSTLRVLSLAFVGDSNSLSIETPTLPFLLDQQSSQIGVMYSPNGNATPIVVTLLAVAQDTNTGVLDTAVVLIKGSVGPFVPPDTITLKSMRTVGQLPTSIRYKLILESTLDDDIGFALATFRYKKAEINPGDYTITSEYDDGEFRYTTLQIVPDRKRNPGDTIADFIFYILAGDTNNRLDLTRLEWFERFTGERIYTYTVVDEAVVSGVELEIQASTILTLCVSPNPAATYATIALTKPLGAARLVLYSVTGHVLMDLSQGITNEDGSLYVAANLSTLPAGTYFLRLAVGAASVVRPFVIVGN